MSPDKLHVRMSGISAGHLVRHENGYSFAYNPAYSGPPVSLVMPVRAEPYTFDSLPPFFDGLLPEGVGLEGLLREQKLDRSAWMGQLLAVGADVVGAITLEDTS